MRWKLFGFVPFLTAAGPDRTPIGGGPCEHRVYMPPSVLAGEDVSWTAPHEYHSHVPFSACNQAEIDFVIGQQGQLRSVSMPRWGNPG
jgi:hypothetical protein